MRALQPVDTPRPRPGQELGVIRSYLLVRATVGVLAILLPMILILGDALFLEDDIGIRGSMSAYYHSAMRDVFVGTLCVVGVLLVTYKLFQVNLDNTFSLVAGIAVLVVAFFPTSIPTGSDALPTPLQQELGEQFVSRIHFTAAAVFILLLATLSYFFGRREGHRTRSPNARFSPAFWRTFHYTCAALIVGAVAFILVTSRLGWFPNHRTLIGEIVAFTSFGASWAAKGFELDLLFRSTGALPPSDD